MKSIICLNIIDNKKVIEIKNAHSEPITNFRHFLDKINERDIFLSISIKNSNIKLLNFSNMECIANIENVYKNKYNTHYLLFACFLTNNNQNFILTGGDGRTNFDKPPIKIFNFKGICLKDLDISDNIFLLILIMI